MKAQGERQREYSPSDSYPKQGDREALKKARHVPVRPRSELPSAAEEIASVVADLRDGRVRLPPDRRDHLREKVQEEAHLAGTYGQVIDATDLYWATLGPDGKGGKKIRYYEDHPCITPPFNEALICYQNGHGNVIVVDVNAIDCSVDPDNFGTMRERVVGGDWGTVGGPDHHVIDWDRVRWITQVLTYVGGQGSDGRRLGTMGPVHAWRFAIYETGEPADISWINLTPDYPMELWDMALLVILEALNFLNCKNIYLTEPPRSRPSRKRIARTGVVVKVLNVAPVGRYSESAGVGRAGGGVPLTHVRGHFSRYGPQWDPPRKLLFGKYAGQFWIPQHARGSEENGEVRNTYRLDPRQRL